MANVYKIINNKIPVGGGKMSFMVSHKGDPYEVAGLPEWAKFGKMCVKPVSGSPGFFKTGGTFNIEFGPRPEGGIVRGDIFIISKKKLPGCPLGVATIQRVPWVQG